MKQLDPEQIEAIEAALRNAESGNAGSPKEFEEQVIAELTKPEWTPKVGQWVIDVDNDFQQPLEWSSSCEAPELYRPLTATEIGLEPFTNTAQIPLSIVQQEGYDLATRDHNKSLFGDEVK